MTKSVTLKRRSSSAHLAVPALYYGLHLGNESLQLLVAQSWRRDESYFVSSHQSCLLKSLRLQLKGGPVWPPASFRYLLAGGRPDAVAH